MKTVILAAGKGKRMKSGLPKVLNKLAGTTLLEHVINTAKEISEDIYIVVGYKADEVKKKFPEEKFKVKHCIQEPQKGTGHALMIVKENFKNNFSHSDDILILLGDVPLIQAEKLEEFYKIYTEQSASAAMLTLNLDDPTDYGRVKHDESGNLLGVIEEKDASETEKLITETNSGIFLFKTDALFDNLEKLKNDNAQGEYYLPDLIPLINKTGKKCIAVNTDEIGAASFEVMGVNSKRDLAVLEVIMQQIIIEKHFDNGVTITDPNSVYIEADVEIGEDTVIHPFTVIRNGVKIGKNCEVGTFAHLRVGTILEDTAEIGDFCETKKAVLKAKVKAKHLSYLGDVIIGARTNIGAGTIIANYDGKKKHQTIIEEDSFIGSGSILVAPVKIGKGATTGAGAVVTKEKDVKNGETVIGIPAKKIKSKETND